jgi:N-acetylglucosamine kinase-like BadF-type ATPase
MLRAGTERGWGVAVVCGAGINCVGVGPDGRHVRFPALGSISGDWGGGFDVGLAALSAAARGEDGRGPRTELERVVPEHFRLESPSALAEAIHLGSIPLRRLVELPPRSSTAWRPRSSCSRRSRCGGSSSPPSRSTSSSAAGCSGRPTRG